MTAKDITSRSTETVLTHTRRKLVLPFGQYEVLLIVTEDNKVIDIEGIRIKKDFMSPEQALQNSRSINVDAFYQD